MSYHRTEIIGNLGGTPRFNYMQDGTAVVNISVATNRKWTNQDGTKGEETIWWEVSAFGRLAEVANEYLTKGQQIFVEGRITVDKETGKPAIWIDNEGYARASLKLQATNIIFGTRPATAVTAVHVGARNSNGKPPQRADSETTVPYSHAIGGGVAPRNAQQRHRAQQSQQAQRAQPQQRHRAQQSQQAQRAQPQQRQRRSTQSQESRIQDLPAENDFGPDEIPF